MSYRVFISSTFEDLLTHRQELTEALRRLDMVTLDVVEVNTRLSDIVDTSTMAMKSADVFVGIYASHYGDIVEGHEHSLIELVYDEAVRLDLPRYIYLIDPGESWPVSFMHTDHRGALMRIFLDRIRRTSTLLRYFTTPEDLVEKAIFDLARLKTAPPPPEDHVYNRRHFFLGAFMTWGVMLLLVLFAATFT